MAKMSKAARIASRARRIRERGKTQIGMALLGGGSWLAGGFTGDRMAKDQLEGKDPNITIMGRAIPRYEAMGGAGLGAMLLFGHKLAPEVSGAVTGVSAGLAAGAAAVRRHNFRLANPEG